jgi:hypothetical protein
VSDLRIILHTEQAGKTLENGNKSISFDDLFNAKLFFSPPFRFDAFSSCKRNFSMKLIRFIKVMYFISLGFVLSKV